MKKLRFVATLAVLLSSSSAAFAEGGSCPSGYIPIGGSGAQGCAPMNHDAQNGSQQPQSPPAPRWETRWGAIAIDAPNSKFAGVDGLSSSREAKKAATQQCLANGGRQCKVLVEYYDQCGALAWGAEGAIASNGPNVEEAMEASMAACSENTTNCQVYYSGCSYPERVK